MGEIQNVKKPTMRKGTSRFLPVVITLIALVGIAAAIFVAVFPWPCTVNVNGVDEEVTVRTTYQDVIRKQLRFLTPGNLVAVDGTLLEEGGGTQFVLYVNGTLVNDTSMTVSPADTIVVENGADVVEDSSEEFIEVKPPVLMEGKGAVHRYMGMGVPGYSLYRTGLVSGIVYEEGVEYQGAEVVRNFNVDTHGDKVIALTFDDGPWQEYTEQILDVLKENDAKATFFTVGNRVAGLADVVRRAYDEGNQICTHTWDHAAGSGEGVNLDYMTAEEQVAEVLDGYNVIAEVTGHEASHVIRVPGGNFSENTARLLAGIVSSEIGWNIDTNDWQKPGANVIYDRIMQAEPGNIILLHDGGGDRSQTVEALRNALPLLREQGYRFVTIDELLAYAPATAPAEETIESAEVVLS